MATSSSDPINNAEVGKSISSENILPRQDWLCTKSQDEAQHLEVAFETLPQLIDFLCKASLDIALKDGKNPMVTCQILDNRVSL
jgi:hypothetical protein